MPRLVVLKVIERYGCLLYAGPLEIGGIRCLCGKLFSNRTIAAPSFNGRTADSGSAYRGSNPWGAAKLESTTYDLRNPKKARPAPKIGTICFGNAPEHL